MTRVYVPTTLAGLRAWWEAGAVPAEAPRVLAGVEDGAGNGDEDGEYDALMAAAEASAQQGPAGGRRVVIVAEAGNAQVWDALDLARWVAVHCDLEDRDVEDRATDADPEDDLAWFATQEIPDLI